jgi:chromate reductase, NAD(P)H dehydrogenase (quinone)
MKNIFAISGSLRAGSSNHNILKVLGNMMPDYVNYAIYDGLSQIPAFDPGLDNDSPSDAVFSFRENLTNADGIIICTPEYAFGVPGALKNALDWTVSSASFSGKPTTLITASSSGENAHEAMIKILGAIDAKITPETTLLIQFVRSKMDQEGHIIDPDTLQKLKDVLDAFIAGLTD